MSKILITGSAGQLGHDLIEVMGDSHELLPFDMDLDITDAGAVRQAVIDLRPDLIINSAAMTDVDGCETNVDAAYRVNAVGPYNLGIAARSAGAPIVYIGTDFVFDGKKATPYDEFDRPNPLSVYGKSKLAGERMIKDICPEHYIVRTAWLYGRTGHNFVKTMLQLAAERDEIMVVNDQIGSPTYSLDLARRIAALVATGVYGTYHATNSGSTSWYGFAQAILEAGGFDPAKVKPISSAELKRPAVRPAYSVMRNYMCELTGMEPMRDWQEALRDYFESKRAGQ